MYSKKIVVQLLSELLLQFEIQDVVISPGSRNAPLSIHFANHQKFNTYSIVDERSAGFVTLGMSQASRKPTVLCCTSGSATVNYYPAVVEAFYQNIPLLIISADRPENYVDIFDGQTIRQKNVFEQHSYGNFQLSELEIDEKNLENYLTIKKAIQLAVEKSGPVHINIPFSEPLYETTDELSVSIDEFKIPKKNKPELNFIQLASDWKKATKILFLVGMQQKNEELQHHLEQISKLEQVIVLTESTSNLSSDDFISSIDPLIFNFPDDKNKDFSPDLLITIGQNIVSKKVKSFLRQAKIRSHWHIDEFWQPDTYFCLTEKIVLHPNDFLTEFFPFMENKTSNYSAIWKQANKKRTIIHQSYLKNIPFSDLKVFEILEQNIPQNTVLHFGNSSPIRYAQLFDFNTKKQVFSNRGASGIDGSTSTAIGYSMKSNQQTTMITGDLSFFYDSNALWNNYLPSSFRLIVINNGGGNIFKIIPGPDTSNALTTYFEANHNYSTEHFAKHYHFDYEYVENENQLREVLTHFFSPSSQPKLLEINTKNAENAQILRNYMKCFEVV